MVHTFVDSALKDLSTLVSYLTFADSLKAQIQAFQDDLRFLQMFLRCLITLEPDNDMDRKLISGMHSSVKGIWDDCGEGLYTAGRQAMKKKIQLWNRLSTKLCYKIQLCKGEIKKYCVQYMSSSFQSKLFRGDQILEFLDEILNNSKNLPAAGYQQFQKLREKLLSLRHIVEFPARRCPDDVKELRDFMIHAHTWANKAACLACLYWASDAEDEGRNEIRMNLWIADLLSKVNPCTPEFIQMCFAAMKSPRADANFLYNEFVISFADFLEETMALKGDDNETLREGLIFLISYLTVPPAADHYPLTFHPAEILLLGDASHSGDLTVDRVISKIHNFRGQIEESWELLQAKVFRNRPCPSHLKEVGLSIARNCKGLPLAVVVIAGLLARIPESWSSWNEIEDRISSYLSDEGSMNIIELSYKHLPEALKSCLLYVGAFLEKKNISAKRLMLLWAAEGFAPKSSESSSNFLSMAKQYLNDLVDRSLVIVHQRSSTGGIKRFEVHDLLRDFCRTKAQEEHFFHFIERSNGSNIFSMSEIYKQYRLCIHVKLESEDNAEARRGHSTAHTLIYSYPNSPCSVDALPLSNVKLVQVLDVKAECDTFPEEVTMLVNLRYLTLKTHTLSSVSIPSIIANLWNLETFVLKCFSDKKICLPETIWKMKRLKHVDVGREAVVELDNDVGKDSSKLPNIESFSSVTITYGESGVELLRRLSNVRKLSCYYYTCWDWPKKFEQLPKLDEYLTKLESLNVVSDGPFYPCVPSFPITLKKLSLEGVDLPWSEFYAIAKLPCLEVLKLMPTAFQGSRWDVRDEKFPKLKLLKLYGLDVAEWTASLETFPCLEQIVVESCYNLVEIPDSFAEVPTLKVIEVYDCKEEVGKAAIRIQDLQLDMGNDSLQVRVIEQQ